MRVHRSAVFLIITLAALLGAGAWAQEVPDTPDPPDAPQAADAPDAADAPEAEDAPEAPTATQSLVFETTVDFEFVKRTTLDGSAGEVEIRGVEFASASGKGGLFSSSDPDLVAGIVTKLECSTAAETKQKLDVVIQYLDSDGALIDRVKDGVSFKNGTKTFEISRKTLKYVVPLIAQARITVSAGGKS